MLDRLTASLDYQGKALMLRAERQRVLASNIANADTPGYQARDIDFSTMLARATGISPPGVSPSSLSPPGLNPSAGGLPGAGTAGVGGPGTTTPSMPQPGAALGGAAAGSGAGVQPLPAMVSTGAAVAATHARHLAGHGVGGQPAMLYRIHEQASGDANTVDMDRERANFADNAVRYEATLRFINSGMRQMMSAIRGD